MEMRVTYSQLADHMAAKAHAEHARMARSAIAQIELEVHFEIRSMAQRNRWAKFKQSQERVKK